MQAIIAVRVATDLGKSRCIGGMSIPARGILTVGESAYMSIAARDILVVSHDTDTCIYASVCAGQFERLLDASTLEMTTTIYIPYQVAF